MRLKPGNPGHFAWQRKRYDRRITKDSGGSYFAKLNQQIAIRKSFTRQIHKLFLILRLRISGQARRVHQ